MPKHAGPRDRWFISGVETKAFKSVGSRLLKFPLTLGLTCIVGPNGSGKSNLLDAVCFACGCSPAVMGVQRLADLQCTDVQEVHRPLCLTRCSPSELRQNENHQLHI